MKLEYFLVKERTQSQIMKKYGGIALETVKGLEKLGMVKQKTMRPFIK